MLSPAIILFAIIFIAACTAKKMPIQAVITYAKLNIDAPAVSYTNAFWYAPSSSEDSPSESLFAPKDMYTQNGVFVDERPDGAIEIDLQGAYVIMPFGDANNYFRDDESAIDTATSYLAAGIFYMKNPWNVAHTSAQMRRYWDSANTLDVAFSNGGVVIAASQTDDIDHPLSVEVDPRIGMSDKGRLFVVRNIDTLKDRWPSIIETRPSFIKLYLTSPVTENHSAENQSTENQSDAHSRARTEIFSAITELAKEADLPISLYAQSISDLELAINARVAESTLPINLPNPSRLISAELIEKIAKQELVIMTSSRATSLTYKNRPELLAEIQTAQAKNLRRLYDAGALITIGTDSIDDTPAAEITSLRSLGVFSDQELLELMLKTPMLSVFPDRALGSFAAGHEASFIGLRCDPFVDFSCTQKITHRVKQGVDLNALIAD